MVKNRCDVINGRLDRRRVVSDTIYIQWKLISEKLAQLSNSEGGSQL